MMPSNYNLPSLFNVTLDHRLYPYELKRFCIVANDFMKHFHEVLIDLNQETPCLCSWTNIDGGRYQDFQTISQQEQDDNKWLET